MYLETEKVKSTPYFLDMNIFLLFALQYLDPLFLIEPAFYEVKLDLTS